MKRFLIALAAVVSLGSLLAWGANYTVTQGSGLTFGSIQTGGVDYAQQLICDPTTPSRCAAVAVTGQLSISNTAMQTTLDNINTNIQSPIPQGGSVIGYVGIRPLSPVSGGTISSASAISTTAIPAQGASLRFYMTDFSCANSGVSTTVVHFLNAGSNTPLWTSIIPNSGGTNKSFNSPISTTANTALIVSTLTASTTVYCSVSGFPGT